MAEANLFEQREDAIAEVDVDSDVMPDGATATKSGIEIIDQLDEGNLVDRLEDLDLGAQGVAYQVTSLCDEAKQTMGPWLAKYERALKLAKLEPESEKKTFPFENASIVMMPFILETMLDFHSRTVPELVWAKRVVATRIYGRETEEKTQRADRVADYMNFQISEEIPYWRPQQDKLLLALPCVGTAYKKTYYDGDEQQIQSELLQGDEVIFNMDYCTFEEAPDKFVEEEYTRNEVLTYIRGDQQWKLDEDILPLQRDHPKPFEFIRAWTWLDLDDDGLTEPYEVVLYKETETVVSVYPAYDEDEIVTNEDGEIVKVKMLKIFTQYRFLPDPEGGPMGMGWGILLGDLFDAINTNMRQMIDAGTLSNLAGNSGLIDAQMSGGSGRGNRQQSGPIEVRMGELTPVTTGGKPLGQSVVQFPYSGPNQTLFNLLEYMVTQIRNMTNSALNMETNSQEAAMMYLARLQQGLKVPNSIVMRVYDAAKDEFKKIAELNFKHWSNSKYNCVVQLTPPPEPPPQPQQQQQQPEGQPGPAVGPPPTPEGQPQLPPPQAAVPAAAPEPEEADMRADFNPDDCDIRLATDPSQGSDIERQQRADLVLQEAKTQPQQILNLREAYMNWLEALNVADIEGLAPPPSNEPDPMQKMMLANMQREAELAQKEMDIREARLNLDQQKETVKAMREGAEYGLKFDEAEATIMAKYAEAFKKLWEIGMAGDDPVRTVQDIEKRLIDRVDSAPPPVPLESPRSNPPAGGQTPAQ